MRRARFSRKNRAAASVSTTAEPLHGLARALAPAPTYSVVIPATDQPATLEICLQAIYAATDAPTEVIVVDGPPGMGPAAARNAGTTRASGSILIFIDSDVAVHPDVFTRSGRPSTPSPSWRPSSGRTTTSRPCTASCRLFATCFTTTSIRDSGGLATTFWAGLGAVRREAFVEVDGFDDWRFRSPSVEDIELGLRLASAGGMIRLDPEIQGTHLKHWGCVACWSPTCSIGACPGRR